MRAALPLLPLLALALAGCAVEPPTLVGEPARPGGPAAQPGAPALEAQAELPANATPERVVLEAPTWQRGDWWRWSITEPGRSDIQQLVVRGEQGPDYLVGATERDDAVFAAFWGRSFPGRVSKATLSGYDDGVPTRFLDFPLEQNKTWALQVRDTSFAVRATFSPNVDGAHGPGFLVEGQAATGERVALTYAASVRWMTRFAFTAPGGETLFLRELVARGTNHTGPVFNAVSEGLFAGARNGTSPSAPADTFSQGRGYTLLHLALFARGSGSVDVRVLDPSGQVRYEFQALASGLQARDEEDLPSAPGTWRVVWSLAGPVDVFLRIAGIEVTQVDL